MKVRMPFVQKKLTKFPINFFDEMSLPQTAFFYFQFFIQIDPAYYIFMYVVGILCSIKASKAIINCLDK